MKTILKGLPGWARILIHLAAMAVAATVLVLLLFRWMDSYTRHGHYITVPDVTGQLEDEAAAILKRDGLRCETGEYRYAADLEAGQVIEQRPSPGFEVKENRIIYLTVNSGRIPLKAMPDVADNSSYRSAESKLLGAGFKLTEPKYIPGDEDWVYEVLLNGRSLRNGEEVPEGSELTIVVGNGEEETDSLELFELDPDFFQ